MRARRHLRELQDRRLTDLLVRVAEGHLPRVSVLITKPLSLPDSKKAAPISAPSPSKEIDEPTAIALLRQRGRPGHGRRTAQHRPRLRPARADGRPSWRLHRRVRRRRPATPLELTRFEDAEQAAARADERSPPRRADAGIQIRPHRRALSRRLQCLQSRGPRAAGTYLPVPARRHG